MKILVTGGTGFIGSHTVVELQNKGYEVVIVDNLSNSSAEVADGIEQISGVKPELEIFDLTNKELTADFFKRHNDIAGVIHFAAYKAVGESVQNPLMYYSNNLESLVNILKGMKDNNIKNIVFSSSCTVYGQPDELPVSEDAPVKFAESPYGNTKQISEEIIRDTVKATDIHAIALRYFNPIGAHPSTLIGELPIGVPNNLIPFVTQTAIGIREQLSVFGDDYPTPDGTAIRDYIHVVDLAKAHVIAVDRMVNCKMNDDLEIFNLGTGNGYSVLDVIKSFEKMSGVKLNYKIVARREGDITQVWANPDYSNKVLGWKAELGLDAMTKSAWDWELKLKDKK